MPESVIADTSCLIILTKIEALFVLKQLYGSIYVTDQVKNEFGEDLPEWVTISGLSDKKYLKILALQLDPGEASAIALAMEMENPLLILDDRRARKVAGELNLKITGTLGVLIKARKSGHIKQLKPFINKLVGSGFYISDKLQNEILSAVDEKDSR